jgi:CARDB protein
MRRWAVIVVALAAAAPAGAVVAPDAARPKAVVKLKSCSLEERSAVFHARIRRVDGTERMGMKFTLLERSGAGRYHKVKAPKLRRWRKSKPGVGSFRYRQRVEGLTEGWVYKMLVRYRWYGEDGERIKSARRTSRACRQFVALPNLRVQLLYAGRTNVAGVWRYDVRVRNTGRARALDVPVQLSVDGATVNTLEVSRLSAGEARTVRFRGPACEREFSAEADPDGAINETDETDNGDTSLCATAGY